MIQCYLLLISFLHPFDKLHWQEINHHQSQKTLKSSVRVSDDHIILIQSSWFSYICQVMLVLSGQFTFAFSLYVTNNFGLFINASLMQAALNS